MPRTLSGTRDGSRGHRLSQILMQSKTDAGPCPPLCLAPTSRLTSIFVIYILYPRSAFASPRSPSRCALSARSLCALIGRFLPYNRISRGRKWTLRKRKGLLKHETHRYRRVQLGRRSALLSYDLP